MTRRARHWRDRNYEPVGRFSDLPREPAVPAAERPVFTLRLRPLPGVDPTRALRWSLKLALRGYGFECVDYSSEPPLT
jgi:hypothetical protein